jgi:hypothetical protein
MLLKKNSVSDPFSHGTIRTSELLCGNPSASGIRRLFALRCGPMIGTTELLCCNPSASDICRRFALRCVSLEVPLFVTGIVICT